MRDQRSKMREELDNMIEREYIKLWRIARDADKHGCSDKLVSEIRAEGDELYSNRAYPERVLAWDYDYKHKYAFKF